MKELEVFQKGMSDAFKQGVLTGINYMIAFRPELSEEFGSKEITWKDLEDWGYADILNKACEETEKKHSFKEKPSTKKN